MSASTLSSSLIESDPGEMMTKIMQFLAHSHSLISSGLENHPFSNASYRMTFQSCQNSRKANIIDVVV
jgi:hypothetical protein